MGKQLGLGEGCRWQQQVDNQQQVEQMDKQGRMGSHNIRFRSVYDHGKRGRNDRDCEVTTFQDQWITVDYIFYTPKTNGGKNTRSDNECLNLVAYKSLPTGPEIAALGGLPSEICPSDHLPLVADFLWTP